MAGCVRINSISITQIPKKRSNIIKASAEKNIFLGINSDNYFVDYLVEDLQLQCIDGDIQGILTKDEVIDYGFWHTRRVIAEGYCNK